MTVRAEPGVVGSVRLRGAFRVFAWWLVGLAGATMGAAIGGRQLLRAQAQRARRVIGKPLDETLVPADRVWRKQLGDPLDLLLLGDSIAAGLGAQKPKHTLGGQLSRRLAKSAGRSVRLRTAAQVGAETSMLRSQLSTLPGDYRPDVAVVVIGGNDVTHRVRAASSTRHLGEALAAMRAQGTPVVLGLCPDLGALGALPQPLRSLAGMASRQLAAAQREVTLEHGGFAVSLAEVVGPFFLAQPDRMFSEDRFHPSPKGYERTAKALLPSVLAALGYADRLPHGHHGRLAGRPGPDRSHPRTAAGALSHPTAEAPAPAPGPPRPRRRDGARRA